MPRVIGIDPGTVSIDLCGLEDGTVFLDRSFPTAAALSDPGAFLAVLTDAGPIDLIAGPSGYGLPLTRAQEATEEDLRLAFLAAEGEVGGIGGLRALVRALARSGLPVVLTPGVIHLTSVPEHRKINRVDMGTADQREHVARDAFIESAVKFATALALSVPSPQEFVLSGRLAHVEVVQHAIRERLAPFAPTHLLQGFARVAKEGAQGAALVADGLAGGRHRQLVETMAIRAARGTVLDHLYVVPRGAGPGARSPAARPGRRGSGATGAAAALLAAPGGRGVAREAAPLGRRRRGRPVASRRPAAARLLLATTHRGRHGIDRVRRGRPACRAVGPVAHSRRLMP